VAVAHRIANNGRYSTFRVMVHEKERIIAEFDGVAIQVNTSPYETVVSEKPFF
jgi:hypothetical protein